MPSLSRVGVVVTLRGVVVVGVSIAIRSVMGLHISAVFAVVPADIGVGM